jgi:hypothetical protein
LNDIAYLPVLVEGSDKTPSILTEISYIFNSF